MKLHQYLISYVGILKLKHDLRRYVVVAILALIYQLIIGLLDKI
jgi:hypothetical protein